MSDLSQISGPVLAGTPDNPVPQGTHAGYFQTHDNVRLRYAIFSTAAQKKKGTICLVHGRTEYIEKYFETIVDFQDRGFNVATFDWRGQGGSQRLIGNPVLGFVEEFEDYLTDLVSFHADILLPDCPGPYFLVGHSMGGLVGLLAAARDQIMFERAFLSAPMLAVESGLSLSMTAFILGAAKFAGLSRLPLKPWDFPAVSAKTYPGNLITSDHQRYMRMVNTLNHRPDLEIRSPTIGWGAAAFKTMYRLDRPTFASGIRIPVLMLSAAADAVVSSAAIEHLGLNARLARHIVLPNSRHEIFMENDMVRALALSAFDAFVTNRSTD